MATLYRNLPSLGAAIVRLSESTGRARRIRALEAKSDDELARMGLKRNEIVSHVYRDLMHV